MNNGLIALGQMLRREVAPREDKLLQHREGIFSVDFGIEVDAVGGGAAAEVFEGGEVLEVGDAFEEEGAVEVEGSLGGTD